MNNNSSAVYFSNTGQPPVQNIVQNSFIHMAYHRASKKCTEHGLHNVAEHLTYLSGSHTTLRYNEYDLCSEYYDRLAYEIDDYSDDYLGPFQGRLHNYLSASYSHHENIDRVVETIGGDLEHRYEEYVKEVPPLLSVRGLRNFAQHNRPLPLEVSESSSEGEIDVFVDIDELARLDSSWDQTSAEYYFHPFVLEQGDSDKLEVMRAIESHYEVCSMLKSWIPGKALKMNGLKLDIRWREIRKPVYRVSNV